MAELLSGKQLVAELKRRGVGSWTPAVVRRWIHEEPPCPIAEKGRPGQSHRYDVDQVLAWLRERDERAGIAGDEQPGGEQVSFAPAVAPADGDVIGEARDLARDNPTIQKLLEVLEGRDPRNWKAAEEALLTRHKRLVAQAEVIPVDELHRCLQVQAQIFVTGASSLRNQLKMALAEAEDRGQREAVIDREVDLFLERIAESATDVEPEGEADVG